MPSARWLGGVQVHDSRGRFLGEVAHVLFHPAEPSVAGVAVKRPRLLWAIPRKDLYLPWSSLSVQDDVLVFEKDALSGRTAEKAMGFSWEMTVIWLGMSAHAESGDTLGSVRDVAFGGVSGEVKRLVVTSGAAADLAVGGLEVPGEMVIGFDGEGVVVADAAGEIDRDGGLARVAGLGSAVLKVKAEGAVRKARGIYGRLRDAVREGFKED